MPRISVTFAESAVRDLEEILAWYTHQEVPEVGRRLISDVFHQAGALADHSDLGRIVTKFGQTYLRA